LKVAVLIENSNNAAETFFTEHGLSIYVEFEKQKFLIDTGQSGRFLQNASLMKIDLAEIDYVIISHGHYDHIGGLQDFLALNSKAKIILSPSSVESKLFSVKNGSKRFIGNQFSSQFIEQNRLIFVENSQDFAGNFSIITNIGKKFRTPLANQMLFKKVGEKFIEDDFSHEIMACFATSDGIVVFTGCAHSGILNILNAVNKKFSPIKIKAVIGGFHLPNGNAESKFETEAELLNLGKTLAENYENVIFYTGHCTGSIAFQLLQTILSERFNHLNTGLIFTLK